MKKVKKLLAMIMAMTMVLGMAMTVSAAGNTPTARDAMDVSGKIEGVEEGATITAYQIIDAVYNDNGFVKYVWVAGEKAGQDVEFTESNGTDVVVGLTDRYITSVAQNTTGLTQGSLNNLPVGTWLLLVTGTELDKVYNPMVLSVYYTVSGSDDSMGSGNVNAGSSWSLETTGAYEKSSEIPVDKTADEEQQNGEVGDLVEFTISSEFPSYSASSTATFEVTDTIINGLAYEKDEDDSFKAPVVKFENGTEIANTNYQLTWDENGESFTITFNESYLKSLASSANRKFTITYNAVITEEAIVQVGENQVKVEYEHGSTEDVSEYVYTVSFDGIVKKVGAGEDAEGLAGAVFTLYDTWTDKNTDNKITADELSGEVATATTTAETGYTVDFKGLDADKTYYLTETSAPNGYTINSTVYKIEFKNLVHNVVTGKVTYEVWVNGNNEGTVEYGQKLNTPAMEIENTKIPSLPSTGGIGTTIFTIGGCAIMIAAAALYFASKRKSEEN